MSKQANGTGAIIRPQVSADDAAFIAECLMWNKMSYAERAKDYRETCHNQQEIDDYNSKIYEPTQARMDKCIDLMRKIKGAF